MSGSGDGPTSTARTLYIGSLYEEDISNPSNPAPPYTAYYTFGGKLVGMRRANYPDGNGQLRVVGDWLGSTTLVLDTASPPQVVGRQYYKPYGEVALSQGSSRTSVGYTGQRLDGESGLMYYGARFYDPVLSYFVSADPVAPNPGDPKSRNRYSYVLNNPLRYTDPTGYSPEDFKKCKAGDRNACLADFSDLNIDLENEVGFEWTTEELIAVLEAVHDLMDKARWSYSDFKSAMAGDKGRRTVIIKSHKPNVTERFGIGLGDDPPAFEYYSDDCWFCSNKNIIVIYDGAINELRAGNRDSFKETVVHELGHAWDSASGDRLSKGLMKETGSTYKHSCLWHVCEDTYTPGGVPVSGYHPNEYEDFAESVAAAVYPERFTLLPGSEKRTDFVKGQFGKYRK